MDAVVEDEAVDRIETVVDEGKVAGFTKTTTTTATVVEARPKAAAKEKEIPPSPCHRIRIRRDLPPTN